MKTIIAGSRTITNYSILKETINESNFVITLIIEGGALGVDRLGRKWAVRNRLKFLTMNAKWKLYGNKIAGRMRNNEMAKIGEQLIAVWDGKSTGTYHMIQTAIKRGLNVFVRVHYPPAQIKSQRTFINMERNNDYYFAVINGIKTSTQHSPKELFL